LDALPEDRQEAIRAVRDNILAHLPEGFVEVMNWGMVCYEVPLAVYPNTYNKKPLMFAGLASQKKHMAVYLMGVYGSAETKKVFLEKWKATGKKLDMGASCVRFKKLEDLNLDLIAEAIGSTSMEDYVAKEKAFRAKRK
jgi:hypothetical protein